VLKRDYELLLLLLLSRYDSRVDCDRPRALLAVVVRHPSTSYHIALDLAIWARDDPYLLLTPKRDLDEQRGSLPQRKVYGATVMAARRTRDQLIHLM
jgi:hypothetical protein